MTDDLYQQLRETKRARTNARQQHRRNQNVHTEQRLLEAEQRFSQLQTAIERQRSLEWHAKENTCPSAAKKPTP